MKFHPKKLISRFVFILILGTFFLTSRQPPANAQDLITDPPDELVKLIFIHHSVGEAWLADGNGDLGRILGLNNYFVSDTNYGWGPDSIGDNTDYHNWYDWFVGPESPRYISALYQQSGTNSSFSRTHTDPGGENRVILFKSCFPNSDLAGRRDDPATDGESFTIGHAKFVYNQLLTYFITRPDKLFIAITPPPLLDPANALNAREFSRWLVEDWLAENDYPLDNVAVWDLHNLLTHPNNHHRFMDGRIDYTFTYGPGTLYYDSLGDEHPNRLGNEKATSEFVDMLNIFYHRWKATAPDTPPNVEVATPTMTEVEQTLPEKNDESSEDSPSPKQPPKEGVIDDFESDLPPATNGWEPFWDVATPTTLSCGVDSSMANSGASSLRIDFHVEPNGWATCTLFYNPAPDFRAATGISFDYRASAPALSFDFDAHAGRSDARSTFFSAVSTMPESVSDWVHVDLTWDQIVRVDWEENPGTPVNPAEINGFAFGFGTDTEMPNSGTIWIDNLAMFFGDSPTTVESQPEEPAPQDEPHPTESGSEVSENSDLTEEPAGGRKLCPGSMALIGAVGVIGAISRKKRRK